MKRDDFKQATKTLLRSRVSGLCSNPDCGVATLGAALDPALTANIGEAAHIHAASPGGPRYLKEMSKTDRTDPSNGIWLCGSCASRIDRDVDLYPADTLREWKHAAETAARKGIGKRPPREQDANDTLLMAFSRVPVSYVPKAIENIHHTSAEVLRQLDDRFDVQTSFDNRGPVVTLLPREPVPIRFVVGSEVIAEWKRQMQALIEHGEVANLPSDDVKIQGSPLFDKAFTPEVLAGGKLTFIPKARAAVAKMCLVDPATKTIFQVDDLRGAFTSGTQSFTFSGSAYADLLTLSIKMPLTAVAGSEGDFTIGVDFDKWVGKPVAHLPYFDRLREFYSKIRDGWVLDVKVQIDGVDILGTKLNVPADNQYAAAALLLLEYTNRARILVTGLKQKINFYLEPPFSSDDHMRLDELVDILQIQDPLSAENVEGMSCSLIATENADNIRALKEQRLGHLVVFRNESSEPLVIFGQVVELPALITTLEGVLAVVAADVDDITAGDAVHVAWEPGDDFKFSRRFETEETKSDFWHSADDEPPAA